MALAVAPDLVRHDAISGSSAGPRTRLGLIFSLILHAGILFAAAVSIGSARPPVTPDEVPVEISLLTTSDFANIRKGSETSKEKTTAAKPKEADPADTPPVKAKHVAPAPPPPAAADPTPPEPKPDPKPQPEAAQPAADPIAQTLAKADPLPPEPKPDPVPAKPDPAPAAKPPDPIADVLAKPDPAIDAAAKAAEAEQKRKAAADAKKQAEAEAKKLKEQARKAAEDKARKEEDSRLKKLAAEAKKKQKQLASLDKLQAQISQLPDAAPDAGSDVTPDPTAKTQAAAVGVKHATGTQLSATESQMYLGTFSQKVRNCWTVLAGATDARDLVVPVSFDLNNDGSLKSDPVVTSSGASASFGIAAENVVRAIKQCGPYPMPGDYAKWQHWDIDFDPRAMFGG